jgi:hypothetical protein
MSTSNFSSFMATKQKIKQAFCTVTLFQSSFVLIWNTIKCPWVLTRYTKFQGFLFLRSRATSWNARFRKWGLSILEKEKLCFCRGMTTFTWTNHHWCSRYRRLSVTPLRLCISTTFSHYRVNFEGHIAVKVTVTPSGGMVPHCLHFGAQAPNYTT